MKQVIRRKLSASILRLSLVFLLTFSITLSAQEGDPAKGKSLFNSNCAACHQLDKKMTGPALRNVMQRLEDSEGLDREWMNAWIRNSAGMVKSGDAYANKIYNEYGGAAMTAFPQLSDQDISDILAYTAEEVQAPAAGAAQVGAAPVAGEGDSVSNKLILGALAVLFGLLAFALMLVNKTLRNFAEAKGVDLSEDKSIPLWKAFVKNQFLVIVTVIIFLLAAAYFAFGYFMQIGVDQGYQPVQPIHFSHKIHAGDNGIDCKYCHSSARVSKTSGIPSLNVCMNCHKSVYEYTGETTAEYSKEFYDGEIQKLYEAAGWSDADQKYTGEAKPVKWIRIHNLPDFAYFNHSQHVTVAGLECQTCHGPVEEMEIMYQHSPLTMGWCVNCHRDTNVKVKDNAYYTKIHEELSKKYGVEELTAAQMGGLECGKCHY
ncbi:c-type cytochrome [Oceanihabitans sediminis]|uniref:Cytochrome C n=1 Tax=Oceanihabitans sediminis TaxID=1812012 RepID=A0A368PAQ3_9FLAO|nr:c-type cytochrome [Oceanihabitans sediminis]MDX1278011.1 cytochrome c3 family protein [Oceanihabitans sediminis]MDX1772712.1 cytochrome c3 family protein [Oceanihabitans sediminis]RCU58899.1 cytochrome C [Oceanihabitans sediminis]